MHHGMDLPYPSRNISSQLNFTAKSKLDLCKDLGTGGDTVLNHGNAYAFYLLKATIDQAAVFAK